MIEYFRLSGGGNDFLALVEPERAPTADEIVAWCRRGLSLGADGLFLLEPSDAGARMTYFNADGRRAELCLNGTRCAAQLAVELGWSDGEIVVETDGAAIPARRLDPRRVELDLPAPPEPERIDVEALSRRHEGWSITVGVPHFVLFADEPLETMELDEVGPALRYHERFEPAGTNVDWIALEAGGFAIRSWERGVEAETLACGTGVLASAAAGVAAGRIELPADARTRGGFVLTVGGESEGGRIRSWSLAGDARVVARGTILPGANLEP